MIVSGYISACGTGEGLICEATDNALGHIRGLCVSFRKGHDCFSDAVPTHSLYMLKQPGSALKESGSPTENIQLNLKRRILELNRV